LSSGYVLSFVSFHERGFRVPASRFMRAILHFYGVELHNLNPNSIAQAAIFAAVCEGFLARVQQYIPAILVSSNKGWQRRWFHLWNDDGRLPSFSQRVVTAAGSNWRYGAPRERQKNLQPLLEALQELRDGGLTAAGVVKGKCALGPFLSILLIECQHKCFCVNLCKVVDKVQIKSKGMFLDVVHCFMD
jgi:hypothetical protein